ncbi:MAG: hypothetical protein QOE72_3802 [Chloroflexota bacterium]|jgi:hypothetical protein|nr:hypothetical protein [Chloroflexota bacterium]
MLAELLRGGAALSAAGLLAVATGLTVVAEITPTPVTPVTETPASQADQATGGWVTVPLSAVPSTQGAGAESEHPTASAKSLQVSPLRLCASCAQTGSNGGSAHALTVLGTDVAGGESSGTDSHQGSLVMVPANPLLALAIANWMADTRADGSAHSRASLIDIAIGPKSHGRRASTGDDRGEGAVTLSVVESDSSTSVQPSGDVQKASNKRSTGNAETNVVDAGTGDQALALAVAHSDSSGDGQGKAYVAGVNKDELVSSEQTGQGIPVEVPGVTKVVLVENTGTDRADAASVGTAEAPPASSVATSSIADIASTAGAVSTEPSAGEVSTPSTGTAAVTPSTGVGGATGIPTTGAAMSLAGVGATLLIVGAGVLGLSARRRSAGAR